MSNLLYSRLLNEETKEYEVINQIEAEELGWEQHELDVGADGNFYEAGFAPKKIHYTKEEQRIKRAKAYVGSVDPITAHIQRLKDEEQTEEVIAEINALKSERNDLISMIKEYYPYPENES